MFQLFRSKRRTMKIVLGIIVAPIIITMVVTLIPGIFGSSTDTGGDTTLAEVGGETVTLRQAQEEMQEEIRTRRLPAGAINFLAPQMVENLITEMALLQEAERLGLSVSETELAEFLRVSLTPLFPGGKFVGREQYAGYVQQRFEKSIAEFEALLRKDLTIVKLRKLVTDGVTVTPAEIEREFRERREKAKVDYVNISAATLQSSVTVSQAEIEEHFNKNKANYVLPERRSLQYMILDDAKLAARVQVTPPELERYYNENRDRFRVQERARVSHILLKTTEKKEDEIKKIEAKAQDLLKQARAGKDFGGLAKANSEDEASAKKNGEVGWITRDQTVPEFEQKAFSMKPGEISDLVKTEYGYHIIKLLERDTARVKPFAEVQDTIRDEITRERVDADRFRVSDRARAAANRHAQNLQEAGREVDLPVLQATLVTRSTGLPEIGVELAFMDALFTAAKGVPFGPVQLTGKSVIAVVTEIAPSRPAELADVADRVKNEAALAKASELAAARARQLAEKAKSVGDLKRAAREAKLEVKTSELFTSEGSVPGLGAASTLREAFTAPPHTIIGPLAVGADHVVYQIVERVPPDMALMEGEGKMIRETMLGTRQNAVFDVFKADLRERLKKQGKIKIYQDRVDRFVAANRSGGL